MTKQKFKRKEGPSLEEKVQELVNTLEEGVLNFSYSFEEYKAILEMQALMPHYSFRNVLLAKIQYPHGRFFASFNHWNELGRRVKKGSKAIKILGPRFKKVVNEDGEEESRLIGFLTLPVFAYEQTEGDPLPIDRIKIELEGDCPEAREIINMAEMICMKDDCPVTYGDAKGANGYYVPATHSIVISDTLSVNHRAKTLVHELVHSKVHRYDCSSTQSEKEIVAEGTAFVVCSFFGLDTSDYSFRYVKGWSDNKHESPLIKYGSQISDISRAIINEFKELKESSDIHTIVA